MRRETLTSISGVISFDSFDQITCISGFDSFDGISHLTRAAPRLARA